MSPRSSPLALRIIACFATIAAAWLNGVSAFCQERPVFRSGATRVVVDVSVRSGSSAVGGLTVHDFGLTDNGIPQHVEVSPISAAPGVDVTLVVDVSVLAEDRFESYRKDFIEIQKTLRPDDRLRVIAAGTGSREVKRADGEPLDSLDWLVLSGGATLNDSLAAALVLKPDPARRHLVLALFSDFDNLSTLTAQRVRDIARRSDAVLHIVGLHSCASHSLSIKPDGTMLGYVPPRWSPDRNAAAPETWPRIVGFLPCDPRAFEVLSDAAESTGGRRFDTAFWSGSMFEAFKRAFDEFMAGYLLTYEPSGVSEGGWHNVAVTVLRQGPFKVGARRGYFAPKPAEVR